MSRAAVSVFVFGIYLLFLGITLIVVPNILLSVFGIPATNEVWLRVVGMLVLLLGYYDIMAARRELTDFFRWSVYARASVIVFFTVFVLLEFVSPMLILFGTFDLLGSIWTGLALRFPKAA